MNKPLGTFLLGMALLLGNISGLPPDDIAAYLGVVFCSIGATWLFLTKEKP